MATRLTWTPAARGDFKRLFHDLGRVNPQAAERYAFEIRQKILQLAEHPFTGARRRDIFQSARMLVIAPYVILYETVPDVDEGPPKVIEIVRILHGRRNMTDLF